MYWTDRLIPSKTRCSHYSHHLLQRCFDARYGSTLFCEKHLAGCHDGCPPVRFVWWPPTAITLRRKLRRIQVEDSYGNPGILLQVPGLGALALYRIENRRMDLRPDPEDSEVWEDFD